MNVMIDEPENKHSNIIISSKLCLRYYLILCIINIPYLPVSPPVRSPPLTKTQSLA